MRRYPVSIWNPSRPELNDLVAMLSQKVASASSNCTNDDANASPLLEARLTATFTRPGPPNLQAVTTTFATRISCAVCSSILDSLQQFNSSALISSVEATLLQDGSLDLPVLEDSSMSAPPQPILINQLYPDVIRLHASSVVDSIPTATGNASVQLQLNGQFPQLWWSVNLIQSQPQNPLLGANSGISFTVVSDKVAPEFITSSFGSYGAAALYVTVSVNAA
jgi:hypothetical protein